MTMRANDAVHLGLMLFAFAAAYLVPFELLLLAYVVLGPAHYFTEISWLHDRSYFLPHRGIALAAIMASSGSSLAVIGILIPTLVHVSLFTLVFMTLGAWRSKSRVQALL